MNFLFYLMEEHKFKLLIGSTVLFSSLLILAKKPKKNSSLNSSLSLVGKTVIITGANCGIFFKFK